MGIMELPTPGTGPQDSVGGDQGWLFSARSDPGGWREGRDKVVHVVMPGAWPSSLLHQVAHPSRQLQL